MRQQHPLLEQYQTYLAQAGKSEHTVRAYGHDLAGFIRWWEQTTGDSFQPKVVVQRDILAYRGYLQQRGRTPATTNRRLNGLRKFFRWAKRRQLTPDTPFDLIEMIFVKQQKDTAPAWLNSNQLFLGQRGPLTERGIDQLIAKYTYQARLEQCTAHTLRHSFAKNLVDTGTPLDQVAALLGHETLEDDQDLYPAQSARPGTGGAPGSGGGKGRQFPLNKLDLFVF